MSEPLRAVNCPFDRCDGSGWIEVDAMTSQPCPCREQRAAEAAARRLDAGIPKRFRGVSWDRKPIVDIDPAMKAYLRTYTSEISKHVGAGAGLWLAGPNGTGKSSIAMLVAKTAAAAGHSTAVYATPKLLGDIRSTFDAEGMNYRDLFERVAGVDLLVLDDLGSEKRTEWVLEQLYAIVNERWAEMRATVITTNSSSFELEAQLGARTVSRFAEMCGDQLWIDGRDQRYDDGATA